MTDQTSIPAPLPAQFWQCGFCEMVNVSDEPDPLCIRCGLARARKTQQPTPVETRPQPELVPPPVPQSKQRHRRKKREKHRDITGEALGLPWLHGTVQPAPVAPQAATPAVVAPGLVDRLPTPAAFGLTPAGDSDIEATRVAAPLVSRDASPVVWLLVFEDGHAVALPGDDVVIGRQPETTEPGVATLLIPDPMKELSRTHVRMRRDTTSDTWTVEDLDSANGVATISPAGDATFVTPRQPVAATEYLLIGRLRVRLAHPALATPHPTSRP